MRVLGIDLRGGDHGHNGYDSAMVSKKCGVCGLGFNVPQFKTSRAKYCSHECRLRALSAASAAAVSARRAARGESVAKERGAWKNMIARCYDTRTDRFPSYGGRGISVCDRWRASFDAFLADMGRKPTLAHSLDRIDVNGNYEPGNCRWATNKEQHENRTVSVRLTLHGETRILEDWARVTGIKVGTIWNRLRNLGWPVERALTEPVGVAQRRMLTARGKTMHIGAWARELGVSQWHISYRLGKGDAPEVALASAERAA